MQDNSDKDQVMEIETEKKDKQDNYLTPNKNPDYIHLSADKENLSNSKYMQKIKAERIQGNRRLIIHKITLENFKSYSGIREIGPFHKVFYKLFLSNSLVI